MFIFTPETTHEEEMDVIVGTLESIADGLQALTHRPDKLLHVLNTIEYLIEGELDGNVTGRASA